MTGHDLFRFDHFKTMGNRGRFAEHQRNRTIFLGGEADGALYNLIGQRFAGDDKMQIDVREQTRRFFATF